MHRFLLQGPPFPEHDTAAVVQEGGDIAGIRAVNLGVAHSYARSTDTAEQLLEIRDHTLAGRLGLWLMDASEDEIAKFWESYRGREPRDWTTEILIFHHWTKLNPGSAMEAARRSGVEEAAINGWMMHDPDAALAATAKRERRIREYALSMLTRYHPKLGAKMARDSPRDAHMLDLEGIANEMALEDPGKAMDFLLEMGQTHFTSALEQWTRKDPEAALAWMQQHWQKKPLTEAFLQSLAEEHPKRMKELAATLPNGAMKREIEKKLFDTLVKSDPDAALQMARQATVPRLAAEQLSIVGRTLVQDQPQVALEVMKQLFAVCPDATSRWAGAFTPDRFESTERGIEDVEKFLGDLVKRDPEATMAAAKGLVTASDFTFSNDRDAFAAAGRMWAEEDGDAFAEWCMGQNDEIRSSGLWLAADQLRMQQHYGDSLRWAMQSDPGQARDVFRDWVRRDLEAASRWLDESEISDELRGGMNKVLEEKKP
ncbi:hypothetical protein OJ996_02075 [Luteolibacter sp. GHJ8]|uniref:HEAT repeat protein n=1 Tax=Luteolibacter rhizosphaerae TaxID=2989719 RepID=A0ABT3FXP8_9BACT|nr:hypothetical protein [Luteolibacter rhizosphaerae]MCW1912342.1 hypothetical protein [Luteolibacter rhizosphaerae]